MDSIKKARIRFSTSTGLLCYCAECCLIESPALFGTYLVYVPKKSFHGIEILVTRLADETIFDGASSSRVKIQIHAALLVRSSRLIILLRCLTLLPCGYRIFMINPKSRKPPYEQVGEILKARIESGQYPKDERIPTESELMTEFQIGRSTARRAVGWLRDLGLVETVPTRGTFVLLGP